MSKPSPTVSGTALNSLNDPASSDAIRVDSNRIAQGYRLRGVLGGVLVSAVWSMWLIVGASLNYYPWPVVSAASIWFLFCSFTFVTLVKTNWNLKLPDPGLSLYCLLAASFSAIATAYFGPPSLRAASYLWVVIAFSVGNLSSKFRSVVLTAYVVVGAAFFETSIYFYTKGFAPEVAWQLAAFCSSVIFIAYAIVVIGKKSATSRNQLEHSAIVLDTISEAVFTLDLDGKVKRLNKAATELCDINAAPFYGKPLSRLLRPTAEQDARVIESLAVSAAGSELNRRRSETSWTQFSLQVERAGLDQSIDVESHIRTVSDQSSRITQQVVVLRDITHISMLLRRLQHESSHDDLTGLLNRRGLTTSVKNLVEKMQFQVVASEHALLIVDLDQFKVINDTCGHLAGDQMLKEVGKILLAAVRATDTVARQGGDEFAILLRDTSQAEVVVIAQRILRDVAQLHFQWVQRKFKTGASIGASIIDQANCNVNQAFLRADSALYLAKEMGRGRFQLHCENDENIIRKSRELAWATRIHEALEDNHFELFAQQIKSVVAEESEHYEVLLRLPNERHGFDSPAEFIPSAERFELMPLIDRWVVSRTIEALAAQLPTTLTFEIKVSINLSAQSLNDPEFLLFLQKTIVDSGLRPDRLCFELTESIAVTNLETARQFIATVRSMGCSFSLDDVGAGFSSLNYLRVLKFDSIKIDGHYVMDLENSVVDQKLVESLVQAAKSAGIKSVAEMVERPTTVATLKAIGVDALQGYWIHKPEPLRAILGRKGLMAKANRAAKLDTNQFSDHAA